MAFARLEEGYENAMKDYYKKQVAQLKTLITMLIGQLSKGDRQKIMTICTIDVHARDVVAKMIAQKVSPGLSRVPLFVGSYTTSIGIWEKLTCGQNTGPPNSAPVGDLGEDQGGCSYLKNPSKTASSKWLALSVPYQAVCCSPELCTTPEPCEFCSHGATSYLLNLVIYQPTLPLPL